MDHSVYFKIKGEDQQPRMCMDQKFTIFFNYSEKIFNFNFISFLSSHVCVFFQRKSKALHASVRRSFKSYASLRTFTAGRILQLKENILIYVLPRRQDFRLMESNLIKVIVGDSLSQCLHFLFSLLGERESDNENELNKKNRKINLTIHSRQ